MTRRRACARVMIGEHNIDPAFTYSDAQVEAAKDGRDEYDQRLKGAGYSGITTEIQAATEFYYAEEYHQQYLDKNPAGYCGIGGTGVACGIGTGVTA